MGASRVRIIRQLLTESVLLAGLGGAFGLLLAQWGTEALIKTVPQNIPRISNIQLDASQRTEPDAVCRCRSAGIDAGEASDGRALLDQRLENLGEELCRHKECAGEVVGLPFYRIGWDLF